MSLTVYGIPNCGTCKKAVQWLNAHNIAYTFIDTKVQPPSRAQLAVWATTLGTKAMRNTSGQSYRALGAARDTWSDEEWLDAFAADAMLLKRPLFVRGQTAVMVGFRAQEKELQATLADEDG